MRIAYFDCFAGAAGDMIVAAMLDAGLDFELLRDQLATLGLENLELKTTEVMRAGLRALKFEPTTHNEHHHRTLDDIKQIINSSQLTDSARTTAIAIFDKLARAEAEVHGKESCEIHFHEVGAVDSIVDIVSAAVGLEALGIEKVYCSRLSVGGGTVRAAHGTLPVPAPATALLLKGIPIVGGPIDKELLTPTGAAILTHVTEQFCALPQMTVEAVGCGAGTLDSESFPNVLRLFIGQVADEAAAQADTIYLLETNIDDITGEVIGATAAKLFAKGALDVYTTAISMKHNRPAVKLSVICQPGKAAELEQVIFEAGLTFGIRRQLMQRSRLAREFIKVTTELGKITVKVGKLDGNIVNVKPEFADCAGTAETHNVAVAAVIDAAMKAYHNR